MPKHPGGRPTKYVPSMCETVIELMSEGASKTEVAAKLDISFDTIARWQKEIPQFSDAIKKGEKLSEAWWQTIARENLISHPKGPQLNATLWYMNMKNRFGWKDKQEVEHSGQTTVAHVLRREELEKMTDEDINRKMSEIQANRRLRIIAASGS